MIGHRRRQRGIRGDLDAALHANYVVIGANCVGTMNRMTYLGELEQLVLLATLRLGPDARAAGVRQELAGQGGRRVARGAVYITLDRLVKKGYLRSRLGDPSAERGGRPQRFFAITDKGKDALRVSRDALVRLWSGYESALERP